MTNERRELERQLKRTQQADEFMFADSDLDIETQIRRRTQGIERTKKNLRDAYRRLKPVMKSEIQRLKDAYETVQKIGGLSERLKRRMPTNKVPSLKERQRIMRELR